MTFFPAGLRAGIVFIALIVLGGCTTDISNKTLQDPYLGEIVPGKVIVAPIKSTATVGEAMLKAGEFSVTSKKIRKRIAFTHKPAIARISHRIKEINFDLPPGQLVLIGSSAEGYFYQYSRAFRTQKNVNAYGGLFVSREDPKLATRIYWTWNESAPSNNFYTAPLVQPVGIEIKEELVPLDEGMEQGPMAELIYSGVSGGQIRFVYREFTPHGLARPLFTQDVILDYYPGEIYSFRNARFRIVEAGPASIEFILIQGL